MSTRDHRHGHNVVHVEGSSPQDLWELQELCDDDFVCHLFLRLSPNDLQHARRVERAVIIARSLENFIQVLNKLDRVTGN